MTDVNGSGTFATPVTGLPAFRAGFRRVEARGRSVQRGGVASLRLRESVGDTVVAWPMSAATDSHERATECATERATDRASARVRDRDASVTEFWRQAVVSSAACRLVS